MEFLENMIWVGSPTPFSFMKSFFYDYAKALSMAIFYRWIFIY